MLFQLAWRREKGEGRKMRRKKRRRWREEAEWQHPGRPLKVRKGAASNHEAWSLGLKLPSRSAETRLSRLRKHRS